MCLGVPAVSPQTPVACISLRSLIGESDNLSSLSLAFNPRPCILTGDLQYSSTPRLKKMPFESKRKVLRSRLVPAVVWDAESTALPRGKRPQTTSRGLSVALFWYSGLEISGSAKN